jgi:hypothetical protein
MSSVSSNERVIELVKQLPPAVKREIVAMLEQELAEERRQRQRVFQSVLRRIACETGRDWERLTPDQQADLISTYYRSIASTDDMLSSIRQRVEPLVREAARRQGYDWDAMDEDERLHFFAEWLED